MVGSGLQAGSNRLQQSLDQRLAWRDGGNQPVFLQRVRTITVDTEPIERRHTERGGEVAVRAPTRHRAILQVEADSGRDLARIAAELDAYNQAAREICVSLGVAFVDITGISRDRGDAPDMLAGDGLHPSAAMYERWTQAALPVARALLQ